MPVSLRATLKLLSPNPITCPLYNVYSRMLTTAVAVKEVYDRLKSTLLYRRSKILLHAPSSHWIPLSIVFPRVHARVSCFLLSVTNSLLTQRWRQGLPDNRLFCTSRYSLTLLTWTGEGLSPPYSWGRQLGDTWVWRLSTELWKYTWSWSIKSMVNVHQGRWKPRRGTYKVSWCNIDWVGEPTSALSGR